MLLCEDHPLNKQIAEKLLSKEGVITDWARNGQEAVERFDTSAEDFYAAILMDIRMPVMDGLEAARRIRKLSRPDAKSVPILAMSANAFAEDVKASLAAGMNAHLPKPIDPQALYQALAEQIGKEKC
ncbi:MAG: response regulator [Faecalibacterium sp.]|jgi:CheY-like chemotaxis protein|nr:response regulator [Faecalibacterium sp.]